MSAANKTFAILTFGCKVNAYESEAMREELEREGLAFSDQLPADYIIVNTCAVTKEAEKKDMEKIRSLLRNYPQSKIVAVGCFAQLHPERLSSLAGLKGAIGTSGRDLAGQLFQGDDFVSTVKKNTRLLPYEEMGISQFRSEARAFVKIQDGCDNFCSYCIIPFTRGESRSRKEEDILEEVRRLDKKGYKEIVLIGIDTGAYKDGEKDLAGLCEDLLKLPGCSFRLRISSIEMTQITPRLLDVFQNEDRLVKHFHIPLQAGSEKILEMMGRKYSLDKFLQTTDRIHCLFPDAGLSTDIIVGFPQETEEDFQKTCEVAEKAGFMRLHVFPYSRRPYTKADLLPGQISQEVKKQRVRVLMAQGKKQAEEFALGQVGKTRTVLFEEEIGQEGLNCIYRGYTDNYLDVRLASKEDLKGLLVPVKLEKSSFLWPK